MCGLTAVWTVVFIGNVLAICPLEGGLRQLRLCLPDCQSTVFMYRAGQTSWARLGWWTRREEELGLRSWHPVVPWSHTPMHHELQRQGPGYRELRTREPRVVRSFFILTVKRPLSLLTSAWQHLEPKRKCPAQQPGLVHSPPPIHASHTPCHHTSLGPLKVSLQFSGPSTTSMIRCYLPLHAGTPSSWGFIPATSSPLPQTSQCFLWAV